MEIAVTHKCSGNGAVLRVLVHPYIRICHLLNFFDLLLSIAKKVSYLSDCFIT
uniref:Uncharacterized protein n=1 Tax=Arundo donax TaxID=35708 RepID=A0A0A9E2M3_ARUDO